VLIHLSNRKRLCTDECIVETSVDFSCAGAVTSVARFVGMTSANSRLDHSDVGLIIGGARSQCCCQSNANQSPFFAGQQVLGDKKVAPLAKRCVSVF
jgi:hypothetical protein